MKSHKVSFEKFNYFLRPAKQLERKLLIEALHRLTTIDLNMSDYRYIGFGSVYYADFILFHKYLYISKMTCLERELIPKRMQFNKPYKFIDLKMIPASQYISSIGKSCPLFIWLDYDTSLELTMLEDIDGFIQKVPVNSIIVVTVDARANLPEEEDDLSWTSHERTREIVNYFNQHFRNYIGNNLIADDISEKNFPIILATILKNKIEESMQGRNDLNFQQLFNFIYADNAPMLTLGGMIRDAEDGNNIIQSCFKDIEYISEGVEPINIAVPPLTDRERKWIDSHLVGNNRYKNIPFEIDDDFIEAYKMYAKHYPTYQEIIM